MSTAIDHQTKAIGRLLTQFREAANFISYIEAFTEQSNELEDMFQELLEDRWLDTAVGEQLDILGELLGISRVVPEYDSVGYFGTIGSIGAGALGTIAAPGTGNYIRLLSEPAYIASELSDSDYRIYINAKILKNITDAVINDVIAVVEVLLPGLDITITEDAAEFDVDITAALTDVQKLRVSRGDLIPRPAGVSITFQDNNGSFI